jgi:hypothetical protein
MPFHENFLPAAHSSPRTEVRSPGAKNPARRRPRAGFQFGSSFGPVGPCCLSYRSATVRMRLRLTVWQNTPWQPFTFRLSSPVITMVPA